MAGENGARLVAFGKMAGEAGTLILSLMNIDVVVFNVRNDQYPTWTGLTPAITWLPYSIHGKN